MSRAQAPPPSSALANQVMRSGLESLCTTSSVRFMGRYWTNLVLQFMAAHMTALAADEQLKGTVMQVSPVVTTEAATEEPSHW